MIASYEPDPARRAHDYEAAGNTVALLLLLFPRVVPSYTDNGRSEIADKQARLQAGGRLVLCSAHSTSFRLPSNPLSNGSLHSCPVFFHQTAVGQMSCPPNLLSNGSLHSCPVFHQTAVGQMSCPSNLLSNGSLHSCPVFHVLSTESPVQRQSAVAMLGAYECLLCAAALMVSVCSIHLPSPGPCVSVSSSSHSANR